METLQDRVQLYNYVTNRFDFNISDFSPYPHIDTFYAGKEKETSWKLQLGLKENKNNNNNNNNNYVLECSVVVTSGFPLMATCHIKVEFQKEMLESSSSSMSLIKENDSIKFPNLRYLELKPVYHPYVIFIRCELEILKINSTLLLYRKIESINSVLADFLGFLEDDNTKDISLISKEGKVIRAHKNILTARSEVFAAMFQHDMQENATNRVEIKDLEEELLTEMVRFIYSGDLSTWNYNLAKNMYLIGHRYKIGNLQGMCSSFLKRNFDTKTVVEVLILADIHDDQVLKTACKSFIEDNSDYVHATMGWRMLRENHAHLANEVRRINASKYC